MGIKGDILPGKRTLFELVAPRKKGMNELGLCLLRGIDNLLFGESIDRKRAIHNVRTVPYAAFFVKAILRIGQIQRTYRHDRVFGIVRTGGFYVDN